MGNKSNSKNGKLDYQPNISLEQPKNPPIGDSSVQIPNPLGFKSEKRTAPEWVKEKDEFEIFGVEKMGDPYITITNKFLSLNSSLMLVINDYAGPVDLGFYKVNDKKGVIIIVLKEYGGGKLKLTRMSKSSKVCRTANPKVMKWLIEENQVKTGKYNEYHWDNEYNKLYIHVDIEAGNEN